MSARKGVQVVEIAQVVGPMWSVGGRSVIVPVGEDVPRFVLGAAFAALDGDGPWLVRVVDGGKVHELVLGVDGSVTAVRAGVPVPDRSAGLSGFLRRPGRAG